MIIVTVIAVSCNWKSHY